MNISLETAKIWRLLTQNGAGFVFERLKKNAYDEPTEEVEREIRIVGIFHEQRGYIQRSTANAATTRTKPVPMILTLWDKYTDMSGNACDGGKDLKYGDILNHNGKKYTVIEVGNVGELNYAAEISLEVVNSGFET